MHISDQRTAIQNLSVFLAPTVDESGEAPTGGAHHRHVTCVFVSHPLQRRPLFARAVNACKRWQTKRRSGQSGHSRGRGARRGAFRALRAGRRGAIRLDVTNTRLPSINKVESVLN